MCDYAVFTFTTKRGYSRFNNRKKNYEYQKKSNEGGLKSP